jgi:hypothetical protein
MGQAKVQNFAPSIMAQTAYLARKMDAIQEGARTLLDNSMLLHSQ